MLKIALTAIKSSLNTYKIYFILAIVAALVGTYGYMSIHINILKKKNAGLTETVKSQKHSIDVYSAIVEKQNQQILEDKARYEIGEEIKNDISKVKGTTQDTNVDPFVIDAINKLRHSRQAK